MGVLELSLNVIPRRVLVSQQDHSQAMGKTGFSRDEISLLAAKLDWYYAITIKLGPNLIGST